MGLVVSEAATVVLCTYMYFRFAYNAGYLIRNHHGASQSHYMAYRSSIVGCERCGEEEGGLRVGRVGLPEGCVG